MWGAIGGAVGGGTTEVLKNAGSKIIGKVGKKVIEDGMDMVVDLAQTASENGKLTGKDVLLSAVTSFGGSAIGAPKTNSTARNQLLDGATDNRAVKEAVADSTNVRPTWRQSELDAANDFVDYKPQQSFLNGESVKYGTSGSVRPDYYKPGNSVDVKNYNVETSAGRNNLARNVEKQYNQRLTGLPEGTKQTVLIDVRGQNVSDNDLNSLFNNISNRTNGEVDIIFKRS